MTGNRYRKWLAVYMGGLANMVEMSCSIWIVVRFFLNPPRLVGAAFFVQFAKTCEQLLNICVLHADPHPGISWSPADRRPLVS